MYKGILPRRSRVVCRVDVNSLRYVYLQAGKESINEESQRCNHESNEFKYTGSILVSKGFFESVVKRRGVPNKEEKSAQKKSN